MTKINPDKNLINCTVGEFMEIMKMSVGNAMCDTANDPQKENVPPPHMVYGIKQLATELNVSYNTAYRLYHSGTIDAAVYRHGKCIAFNMDMVYEILSISKKRAHGNYKFMRNK